MNVRPILDQLNQSQLFKTVQVVDGLPELDQFATEQLPAVCLFSISSHAEAENGGLYPQQENLGVYSFCVVTNSSNTDGEGELLNQALEELRSLIFGLSLGPTYSPLVLAEGKLLTLTGQVNAWTETFTNRRTFRS